MSRSSATSQGISKLRELQGESAIVEAVGSRPNERTLEAEFRGVYAEQMAREMEEMFDSDTMPALALFRVEQDDATSVLKSSDNGYYRLESADIRPVDPRNEQRTHWRFSGRLIRKGDLSTFRRVIETKVNSVDNPFGSTSEALVGIDSSARDARWFSKSGQREPASATSTPRTEKSETSVYDATNSTYSDPTLVYRMPYDKERLGSITLWDDWGNNSKTTTIDNQTVIQWQRVYSSEHHAPDGVNLITDNGRFRCRLAEDNPVQDAEEWDAGNNQWSSISLDATDWELADVDATHVGAERVTIYTEWRDPTVSPNNYYPLWCTISMGPKFPVWYVPDNESRSIPGDLEDHLRPIASDVGSIPMATKSLWEKKRVRV